MLYEVITGVGWRHSFQLSLAVGDEGIQLLQPDGRLLRFDRQGEDGRYAGRLAADGEIVADADGYLCVITSYSIHYTKLYDSDLGNVATGN